MKLLLLASALILALVYKPHGATVRVTRMDTTKPAYRYFLTHDNPQRYFQALDSLNIISGLIGKSMLYEDALYWLNARARNLNILYYEGKIDSVKIGGKQ